MARQAPGGKANSKAGSKANRRAYGEGTIYKRAGRDLWAGQITLADGKRKTVYGKRQEDVVKKLTALRATVASGLPVTQDERTTLAAYLADWLERVKPRVRIRTWWRYRELVKHITGVLGKVSLTKLTPQQVERLYAVKLGEGLSPTTVHHLHTVLHHVLRDAVRKGLLARNVTELVDAPRPADHEMTPLTAEQAQTLLEAAKGDRLEALYVLAITTGMRQGELLGLRWRDVSLAAPVGAPGATPHGQQPHVQIRGAMQRTEDGRKIGAPKTAKSRRKVEVAAVAVDALRQHRLRQAEERLAMGDAWEDHDLVFPNTNGGPLDVTNLVRRNFQPLLERAGLPRIRFHDLRHTAATIMLLHGVNPKIVSEMLGHASVSITLDRYSHVLEGMQRDASAAMQRLFGS